MRDKHTIVSLFSGALGLDLGLEQAGFSLRVAVECNKFAAQTIRLNRPELPLIEQKLENVATQDILDAAGLTSDEVTVVTGGPSCQPFSTAGQRKSLGDPRGVMFREFLRVVQEIRPRFFIMENVRGILSAAVRHRPLRERGPGYPPLKPDEELGSAFELILKQLKSLGYYISFDLLNALDYGVPQRRERVIFIGSRDGEPVSTPKRTHAEIATGELKQWVTLREALLGLEDPDPQYKKLAPSKSKYLELIPQGGNWRDLPQDMRQEALGGAYTSWGGRSGFYRRLSWDKPSPALTTRPDSKATMLCHPTKLRPLSVKEYARIQQFPDDWKFSGGVPQQYTQIGNAVPVGLGAALGRELRRAEKCRTRKPVGRIDCPNDALLERLARRPSTILNPARMRKVKEPEAAREWLAECVDGRQGVLRHIHRNKGTETRELFPEGAEGQAEVEAV